MKDGGTLALPNSKPLNDFLADQMLNHYGTSEQAWIGLYNKKNETKFVWDDNSELEWHNFAKGHGPGNDWLSAGIEDCAAMDPKDDGLWYDYQCDSTSWANVFNPQKIFICQYTLGENCYVYVHGKSQDRILHWIGKKVGYLYVED